MSDPLAPIEALVQRWWQIGPRDVDALSLLTQLRAALTEAREAVQAERERIARECEEKADVARKHGWERGACAYENAARIARGEGR